MQPACICLPSRNGQGGRTRTGVLRARPSAADIDPEIGCQTWTRTKTNGLTDRRATLTPPGNGAADRTSTCIVPLRRRVPHVFGHGSISKMVSAAGIAPAVPRLQAEHVAATPRAGRPGVRGAHRGLVFMGMRDPHTLNLSPAARFTKIGALDGTCTHTLPADNGSLFCSATEALEMQN